MKAEGICCSRAGSARCWRNPQCVRPSIVPGRDMDEIDLTMLSPRLIDLHVCQTCRTRTM